MPPQPAKINLTGGFTTRSGGATIVAVKIIIYILTFAVVLVIAAAIVGVSLAVAPAAAKSTGLSVLAVALGGLAVTGGVIYLAEKLINLTKGVVSMVFDLVVEKYKQHRLEAGIKIGIQQGQEIGRKEGRAEAREEQRRAVRAWYERQQAALRAGLPSTNRRPATPRKPTPTAKTPARETLTKTQPPGNPGG